MPYRELQFTVVAEIAEPLGDALMELGALSISVEDAAAGGYDENPLYGEPGLSPEVQAWDLSCVKALFDKGLDHPIHDLIAKLKEAGFEVSPPQEVLIEDQDWVRLTQSQFEPIQVGQNIWIVPSWHQEPNIPNAICLAVDPGLAFGTGSHPTTRLCLEWLEQYGSKATSFRQSLLDYGCGSGILAIAAHKLGFKEVFGTDIDPQAIESARANAQQNQTRIQFELPDNIESSIGGQVFDVVIANILANPLQVLAPALIARLKPGGQLVLSGILERQADEVIASYQNSLQLSIWGSDEGWVCLSGKLTSQAPNAVLSTLPSMDAISKKPWDIKKQLLIGLIALLIAYPFVTALWRMPILHALAPIMDSDANLIRWSAFKTAQTIDNFLCKWIPCDRKAVTDFKAWRFLSANLGIEDAKKLDSSFPSGQSLLQIELQNRLAVPVAIPGLELILTDADEKTIARILLSPEEWLPKTWQSSHPDFLLTGASAGEAFNLSIPLQIPPNAARLRVAYPTQSPTNP
ncbi:MAG: 50S ribosomal protein L11 methyltransferase [Burkholderiaceae bacterium]|nr:50S ribosomal protein L11 methyltransferase [Burkholderiaceae bacterium]